MGNEQHKAKFQMFEERLLKQIEENKALIKERNRQGDKEGARKAREAVVQLQAMLDIRKDLAVQLRAQAEAGNKTVPTTTPGGLKTITIRELADIFKILDEVKDIIDETLKGINLPVVLVIGDEKHGKSSLLQRLIGLSILPRAVELCTKVPIRVRLKYDSTIKSGKCEAKIKLVQVDDAGCQSDVIPWQDFPNPKAGGEEIVRTMMNTAVDNKTRVIRKDRMICIEIVGSDFPNVIFLDLPGLVVNALDPTIHATTHEISKRYLLQHKGHSITLVVRALNADSGVTSQTLKLLGSLAVAEDGVPRIDPEIEKWLLPVFTKADLIAEPREIMRKVLQEDIRVDGLKITSNPAVMTAHGGTLKKYETKRIGDDHDKKHAYKARKERVYFEGAFKINEDDEDDEDGVQVWNDYVKKYPDRVGINGVLKQINRLYKKILAEKWIPKTLDKIDAEMKRVGEMIVQLGVAYWHETRDREALSAENLFKLHMKETVCSLVGKGCDAAMETDRACASLKSIQDSVVKALDEFSTKESYRRAVIGKGNGIRIPMRVFATNLSRRHGVRGIRSVICEILKKEIGKLDNALREHVVDQLRRDTPGGNNTPAKTALRTARFPKFVTKIDEALKSSGEVRKEKIFRAAKDLVDRQIDAAAPEIDFEKRTATILFDEKIAHTITGFVMCRASDAFFDDTLGILTHKIGPGDVDLVESCSKERIKHLRRLTRLNYARKKLATLMDEIRSTTAARTAARASGAASKGTEDADDV